LVLESKAEMRKRGQASPDDGDALCLTFAQPVALRELESDDEEEEFANSRFSLYPSSSWMR
jgi:phage terminase large subunit